MAMTIHTIICARNEADVLEACIRHNARWSAMIHVVLHRCRDNSEEILTSLKSAGIPLEYETDEHVFFDQDLVMNHLARRAAAAGADWILPLDADEFLVGPVTECLAHSAPTTPVEVPWRGYVPLDLDDATEPNVLRRIRHRRAAEIPEWCKVLVPGRLFRDGHRHRLPFGNHHLLDEADHVVPAQLETLSLAHFPVRSVSQLRRKVFGGWLTNLANRRRQLGMTFQWKAIYDELKQDGWLNDSRLREIATEYGTGTQWCRIPASIRNGSALALPVPLSRQVTLDPVPCDFQVSLPVSSPDPIEVLLDTAEAVVLELRGSPPGHEPINQR